MSPGEPGSHMDIQFCNDIHSIAMSLRELVEQNKAKAAVDRAFDDIEEQVKGDG